MFTGEQRDADSGFYYLRARYYEPFLGRFLSQDPVPGGNLYVYTDNNPVNRTDPSGLCFGLGDCGPIDDVDNVLEDAYQAGDDALAVASEVAQFVAPYAFECATWGLSGAAIGSVAPGPGTLASAAIGCAAGVASHAITEYAPKRYQPALLCANWAIAGASLAPAGVIARGSAGGIACGTAVFSWVDSNYGRGDPTMQCLIWGAGAILGAVASFPAASNPVTIPGLAGCAAGGISDAVNTGLGGN